MLYELVENSSWCIHFSNWPILSNSLFYLWERRSKSTTHVWCFQAKTLIWWFQTLKSIMKIKFCCSPTENLCGSYFQEFVFLQEELAVHTCWVKIWKNTGCIQYMSTSRLLAEVSNFSVFFVVGSINFKPDSGCRGLFFISGMWLPSIKQSTVSYSLCQRPWEPY